MTTEILTRAQHVIVAHETGAPLSFPVDARLAVDMAKALVELKADYDKLAVECAVLKAATSSHYYWEDGGDAPEEPENYASNSGLKADDEFELSTGVEIGYTLFRVLNDDYDIEIINAPLKTPVTDAAIASIQANALRDFASVLNAEDEHEGRVHFALMARSDQLEGKLEDEPGLRGVKP